MSNDDKRILNPSTFLNPVPVVLVTCGDNIITLAWAGTICSDPPMLSISVRKERFTHKLLCERKRFVVNLVSDDMVRQTDLCGVKSGRDVDKFQLCGFTKLTGAKTGEAMIGQSPANIECEVKEIIELGSHDLFLAQVVNVYADERLFDDKGACDLGKAKLVAYNHGEYFTLGKPLGFYGYSVASKDVLKRRLKK